MQVSYHLLKEYVDIELSPEELADRLSMNGIVAEHSRSIFEGIEGVVIGEIKEIRAHNKKEHLSVCRVNLKNEELEVLCGAKNMKTGDYVPFALEGAVLPGLGKIEKKEIQGFLSRGMICSASELGLEKSKSPGVLIMDKQFPVGQDIKSLPGISNDVIFDFEIFSNRPDLLSMIGIAREISAFSGKSLHLPEIKITEAEEKIDNRISVQVKDPDLCPRYAGRIVQGIQVTESPFWLRWKLFLLGIRPISNVVDVTNYVMMETGQPLHAFDLSFIHGNQILIRRAYPGEIFHTLDGVERRLIKDNLVIADRDRVIALAGVMGGENSEIKDETEDVFLESAYFEPVNNRRTSQYFALRTDASNRFEKGIDTNGQIYAMNRAASLINQLTPGKILSGIIDEHSENLGKRKLIPLDFHKTERIIGVPIEDNKGKSAARIIDILQRLECQIVERNQNSIKVIPPSFRGDIQRDVDLIEEIAKIFGYDKVPSTLFRSTVVQKGRSLTQEILEKIKDILVGCGMHQSIGYSMIALNDFDWINLPVSHPWRQAIKLSNPLIQDQTMMRTTLIPGILKAVQWNVHRKVEKIKLFEIGKVFFPQAGQDQNPLPLENTKIAGAITRAARGNIWEKNENWDIYYLKGVLEALFNQLNMENIEYKKGSFASFDGEENGIIQAAHQEIGLFGKIHPKIVDFLGIPDDVFLFELDFSMLLPLISQDIIFKPLPKYPSIKRDIAIVVAEKITVEQIKQAILEMDDRIIREVELFDIFRGRRIAEGYKSIAFSIVFQAEDRTLTDQEVDKIMESVTMKLKKIFLAELRK